MADDHDVAKAYEGDASTYDGIVDRADREPRFDADDVEDAVVTALAGLVRDLLEAEGGADASELLAGIEYDVLIDANEFTVQGWIDSALNRLQADREIEFVGTEGEFRPVATDDRDDDVVAFEDLDGVEKFCRAADQVHRAERSMADVDLNAVAYLSDQDVRQFLWAKKTVGEIALRARENQHGAERRRSRDGTGEVVAGPGGDPQ